MTRHNSTISLLLGAMLLFGSFSGCVDSGSNPDNESLIQVRDRVLTVLEFNQAFEIAKTAYPHNLRLQRDDFKNAQLRLLNQLMVDYLRPLKVNGQFYCHHIAHLHESSKCA